MFPSRYDRRNAIEISTVSREPHSGREQNFNVLNPRPISIGQLHELLRFHIRPINPVVWLGALPGKPVGNLILKRASRLDAFSGYHFRT